jgi:hypothetical protein
MPLNQQHGRAGGAALDRRAMRKPIPLHRDRSKLARLTIAAFALGALCALVSGGQARAADSSFSMSRAINLAMWFTWPRYLPDGRGIAWPPYKEVPAPPSDAELRGLRAAGFDTVRLPVDPAPFIVFEGRQREEVYAILFKALDRIKASGLKVILDIHPNSRHAVWGQDAVAAGPDAPAFVAVAGVIAEMAARLGPGARSSVALELLNEPRLKCKGEQQERWQKMAGLLVQRARAANPELALIVTGACVSSPDGLLALDPAPFHDANIFYTFHFYEPFSFSHQAAQFIPWPDKYLDGVPWPASARPIDGPLTLMNQRVAAAAGLDDAAREKARTGAANNLRRFYASGAGPESVKSRFDELRRWAERNGIPPNHLLNGEFGVIRRSPGVSGALCPDRLRWLRDVREASEANGFAWSYFNLDGPFALVVSDKDRRLDQGVLSSLGLASACSIPQANTSRNGALTTGSSEKWDPLCCPAEN